MLEFLRRSVKSWVMKVVLVLLIISFGVFWNIGDVFVGSASRTVANVGGTDVDTNLYSRAIRREQAWITQRLRRPYTLADMRKAGYDRLIMGRLVRDAATTEELRALGLGVPATLVAKEIRDNKRFHEGAAGFSERAYRTILGQNLFTAPEYEIYLRGELGERLLINAVGAATNAMPGIAELLAKWQGETRVITIVSLATKDAKEPAKPTDLDLQTFFEANKDRFREPERRWGSFIHVDPKAIAKTMIPTDAEVEKTYKDNLKRYSRAATRDVEQLLFKTSEAAEAAAKKIADKSATWEEIVAAENKKPEDISLGTVTADKVPDATAKAIFALEEPGVAGPVKLIGGWALLNVTKVAKGSRTPFAEVKDKIAAQLALSRALEVVPKRAAIMEEIRADGATMDEIAKKSKQTLVNFTGLAQDGSAAEGKPPALAGNRQFLAELKAAAIGQERDVVQLGGNQGYVLVMLDRIEKPHLPKLEKVKDKVAAAWTREQQLAALEGQVTTLLLKNASGGMEAVAKALKKEPVDLPPMSRSRVLPTIPADLATKIFAGKEGEIFVGRTRGDQSVIVAAIKKVNALEGDALKQAKERAELSLVGSVAADQFEMFGRAIEKRHGARIKSGAVDAVFQQLGTSRGGT